MSSANAKPVVTMQLLVGRYLNNLRIKRDELQSYFAQCQSGTVDDTLHATARRHVHSLIGSGLTYGFPAISTTAREAENQIDNGGVEARLAALSSLFTVIDEVFANHAPVVTLATATAVNEEPQTKPTLLLVDDDPVICDLIASLFQKEANVVTATNGKEALERMAQHRPDLVVMDDSMPEMSGLDALEALRKDSALAEIPVILLTANNDPKDIMRGVMTGAIDYVIKPFNTEQLTKKIRDRLQHQRYTILVADDDPSIRTLLEHKFRLAGCRVLMAEDGEQALQMARTLHPHLMILDRMMPGLDGVAVLQSLRNDPATRDIAILFLTAKRQEQDILEGFRLGAADYVVKPFRPEELIARSLRLLAAHKEMP